MYKYIKLEYSDFIGSKCITRTREPNINKLKPPSPLPVEQSLCKYQEGTSHETKEQRLRNHDQDRRRCGHLSSSLSRPSVATPCTRHPGSRLHTLQMIEGGEWVETQWMMGVAKNRK